MTPLELFLIATAVIAFLGGLLYWLLITTEGVYLGRGIVIWLYDVYANRYDNIKGYDPTLEMRFLARPLMAALSPNTAPMILDVASGTGRLPRALLGYPHFDGKIVAMDLSRKMLNRGAQRMAEGLYYNRVSIMHQPAESLPFPDDFFDAVCCLEAIEFMTNRRQVISELVRVLRPGGVLLMTNRIGTDAKLMPGKTWSKQEAYDVYTHEYGLLDVEIIAWSYDYDQVWATKDGDSDPTRGRPLVEFWHCPQCSQAAMQPNGEPLTDYTCQNCGRVVPVGNDGVIELYTSSNH